MAEAFTYDDLYEMLRIEKKSADLETLSSEDIEKIKYYFKEKEAFIKKQQDSQFSNKNQMAKLRNELENAYSTLKNFYEVREKKIINRSIFSSRSESGLKDTTNMLENEVGVYNQIIDLLNKNRENFNNLFDQECEQKEPKALKSAESADNRESKPKIPLMKLIFIKKTDKLTDSNLNEYGPFEAEDVANLPEELATILVSQQKVKPLGE